MASGRILFGLRGRKWRGGGREGAERSDGDGEMAGSVRNWARMRVERE
jgi:hypothetical protein